MLVCCVADSKNAEACPANEFLGSFDHKKRISSHFRAVGYPRTQTGLSGLISSWQTPLTRHQTNFDFRQTCAPKRSNHPEFRGSCRSGPQLEGVICIFSIRKSRK